jgi:hypothetical protein
VRASPPAGRVSSGNLQLDGVIQAGMPGANLIVFRETSQTLSRGEIAARLIRAVSSISPNDQPSVVNALLLAGEVECALSDCRWQSETRAIELTDAIAALFVATQIPQERELESLAAAIARDLPQQMRISHPEGFAYYALHPGDFADAVTKWETRGTVGVVGIRSVGTTLSAVGRAALRAKALTASRITVRPVGHPYDRKTELDEAGKLWVQEQHRKRAQFLVVDEGPGLSGSSFLSVAECLMREGVPAEQITLMGTRDVHPGQLCAPDAGSRWRKLSWERVSSRISERFKNSTSLCGGAWLKFFLGDRTEQAANWPEMEAVKYWSEDRTRIFKFEGLGEIGTHLRERSRTINEAGFGAPVQEAELGMSCYEFVAGRALAHSDLSTRVLDRIAEYCAFRAHAFRSDRAADGQLEEMLKFNFLQETGRQCPIAPETLRTDSPVIADSRMAPHEWIGTANGRLMKVDGSMHGEDHFLPGPTDIAWDLAGAVIEWDMDQDAERYLLKSFRHRSGIGTENVLAFVFAYSIFRASYCKMAMMGTGVESEKPRLQSAYSFYRRKIDEKVRQIETAGVT